jgi:hypothetical protein
MVGLFTDGCIFSGLKANVCAVRIPMATVLGAPAGLTSSASFELPVAAFPINPILIDQSDSLFPVYCPRRKRSINEQVNR